MISMFLYSVQKVNQCQIKLSKEELCNVSNRRNFRLFTFSLAKLAPWKTATRQLLTFYTKRRLARVLTVKSRIVVHTAPFCPSLRLKSFALCPQECLTSSVLVLHNVSPSGRQTSTNNFLQRISGRAKLVLRMKCGG